MYIYIYTRYSGKSNDFSVCLFFISLGTARCLAKHSTMLESIKIKSCNGVNVNWHGVLESTWILEKIYMYHNDSSRLSKCQCHDCSQYSKNNVNAVTRDVDNCDRGYNAAASGKVIEIFLTMGSWWKLSPHLQRILGLIEGTVWSCCRL